MGPVPCETADGRLISGAMHYFRVHPDLWADRLARLAALGVNTVETYVAWNFHSPAPGTYDFTAWRDLPRYLRLVEAAGLDVILRPGPYICAEWDFGGLPPWLLRGEGMRLRCSDGRFLAAVDDWFDELVPRVLPLLKTAGGPIVAVQVENEYGSYGDDRAYLEHLRDGLVRRGIDVPLFTSDGPGPDWLASGALPGTPATVNFGSRPDRSFEALRSFRPESPLVCMEFWHGWFDHWGGGHHTREPAEAAAVLDEMLAAGAGVNLYVAHGGTNFGLWSGANWNQGLQPTVTSYDYDAPVSESGELTPKFWALREVIARYRPLPQVPAALRERPARLAARSMAVTGWAPLLATPGALGKSARSPMPLPMEEVGSGRGLILYRGSVLVPPGGGNLVLDGLADSAIVVADGARLATLAPGAGAQGVPLSPRPDGQRTRLEVLVENRGRVNFGPTLGERKGVTGIRLAHRFIHGWESVPIELDDALLCTRLDFEPGRAPGGGPVFAIATAELGARADGFLALPGWGRGYLWLNGFLLGRYDGAGPQRTLYAPAPLWRAGSNDLVVLEMEEAGDHLEIREEPDLGEPADAT